MEHTKNSKKQIVVQQGVQNILFLIPSVVNQVINKQI